MQRDIRQVNFYPHPPAKVWEMLTDAALLSQWLMKNDISPVVGHKFNFFTKPLPIFGFDGIVYCEVTEVVPMKRLSYTWKGGDGSKGTVSLDTVVTWTLTPRDNGTELVLEHIGFRGMKNLIPYMAMKSGWVKIMKGRFATLLKER